LNVNYKRGNNVADRRDIERRRQDSIEVRLRRNETVDKALKKLKKKLEKEGFKNEIRKRKHYQKPSLVRHENNKRKKRKKRNS
jgi:small subunit ribosomal protein S21